MHSKNLFWCALFTGVNKGDKKLSGNETKTEAMNFDQCQKARFCSAHAVCHRKE